MGEKEIEKLRTEHSSVIKELKLIRNKESAHTNAQNINGAFFPNKVENLIYAIQEMINKNSSRVDMSTTYWDHIKEGAVRDTNFILEVLHKFEQQRKKE